MIPVWLLQESNLLWLNMFKILLIFIIQLHQEKYNESAAYKFNGQPATNFFTFQTYKNLHIKIFHENNQVITAS